MITKNYSSIYNIKEYVYNNIIPKYFDLDSVNDLNVGLLGYTTELISSNMEDTLNTVTTMVKEMFPNLAQLPESLYNYAALYKMDNLFVNPSSMKIVLLVKKDDILNNMVTTTSDMGKFYISSDLIINVEGIPFMLDYDITIQAKPYKGDYIFTSLYNQDFSNSLNPVLDKPYLNNIVVNESGSDYLGIFVNVHQVEKTEYNEVLITNEIVNNVKYDITYDNYIANFEVFYKEPGKDEYIQLRKLLKNSTPISSPFCYYTFIDDNTVQLSFSTKEKYFQPEFNSELLIKVYTTMGNKGSFDLYKGNDITVISNNTNKYDYNNRITMFAVVQTESSGGGTPMTFNQLRDLVCAKFASIESITTETDLYLNFANSKYKTGIDILFLKKRDDVFERLFSAFSIYKDSYDEIYHTNTLNLELQNSTSIPLFNESNSKIIKPGTLFTYKNDGTTKEISIPTKYNSMKDIDNYNEKEFLFTSPFLINIISKPTSIVGYFLNSINKVCAVDYSYINSDSPNQFTCMGLTITRNAVMGDQAYTFTILIKATNKLFVDLFDENNKFNENMKLMLFIDDDGDHSIYLPFSFYSYDTTNDYYTFKANLKTDDALSLNEKIRCQEVYNYSNHEFGTKMVSYSNLVVNIGVFIKDESPISHKYSEIEQLKDYTLTNIYSSNEDKINLVSPFYFIDSSLEYFDTENTDDPNSYGIRIMQVPLIAAKDLADETKFNKLISRLENQYAFLNDALNITENNYSIDLKFTGTYGRSSMFKLLDGSYLDRLNCSIEFDIATVVGTNTESLSIRLKDFIQEFFESVNVTEDMSIKISNLIHQLEEEFSEIDYVIFRGINDYDATNQVIINTTPVNPPSVDVEDAYSYIPEYVTMRPEDIKLNFVNYISN